MLVPRPQERSHPAPVARTNETHELASGIHTVGRCVFGQVRETVRRVLGGEARLVLRRDDGHAGAVDVARLRVVAVDEPGDHLGVLERGQHPHRRAGLGTGCSGRLVVREHDRLRRDIRLRDAARLDCRARPVEHHGRRRSATHEDQHHRPSAHRPPGTRPAPPLLAQSALFTPRRGATGAQQRVPLVMSWPSPESPKTASGDTVPGARTTKTSGIVRSSDGGTGPSDGGGGEGEHIPRTRAEPKGSSQMTIPCGLRRPQRVPSHHECSLRNKQGSGHSCHREALVRGHLV